MRISAKKIVTDNGLSSAGMIDLVRNQGLVIYNALDDIISSEKHKNNFTDLILNHPTINFMRTDEDEWKEYLAAFEFDDAESVKKLQMAYENGNKRKVLMDMEFELIVDNYYFEKSKVDEVLRTGKSDIKYSVKKDSDGIFIVEIDSAMWDGLSPKIACENMRSAGVPDEVIAYVLSKKMSQKHTQATIGAVITNEIKDNAAHERWVRRLLKVFDKDYV